MVVTVVRFFSLIHVVVCQFVGGGTPLAGGTRVDLLTTLGGHGVPPTVLPKLPAHQGGARMSETRGAVLCGN
jgi:hypothetical protein